MMAVLIEKKGPVPTVVRNRPEANNTVDQLGEAALIQGAIGDPRRFAAGAGWHGGRAT
jgi:hypothetical protein